MKYKLIADIAKSLLLARWKQTLIAAVGVTFSITMFITLLSFMSGLNDMLDGLILNRTPHIRLYKDIKPNAQQPIALAKKRDTTYNFIHSIKPKRERIELFNSATIISALKEDKRVLGVAPKIATQIFYNVGVMNITGVINGIDIEAESKLFFFKDYVVAGNFMDLKNVTNSIILGKGVADKLMLNIGDVIQVTTNKGEQLPLKVVGYFQSGLLDIDKSHSYCSIATTQKLLGEANNYITDLQIKLKDVALAPPMAKEMQEKFGVDAIDVQTANAQFETGSSIRSLISYAVGITLLIVAGFGIYNILNMMIYEKMDSIAILKATGFSGNDVHAIFISIALSIGIVGGAGGLLLGFGLSSIIDQIPFNTASLPTVKTYPIIYNPTFYIIATIFSVVTTYFAGFFPSRKASKIDPVIIIRGK
jgi:lipoprotein-releasing system permease protein